MARSESRVALIAGGSGGIGESVAKMLARAGHIAYIGYYRGEKAAVRISREIIDEGFRAECLALNVNDTDLVETVCQSIFDHEGRLDVLVNCAAMNRESPAGAMDDATWREVMDTNLDGAFRLCRAAAKFMMSGRWGRIVNVSSISATRGGRGQINYAASKAGVEAMTRVLALEYGRKGICVNCVAPGVIETSMSERIRGEHGKEILEAIAVRRFGTPNDVAKVIAFLVSDGAEYITGQTIRVDGGIAL